MKFGNVIIDVSRKVLRPRKETEYWIKRAAKEIKDAESIKVLDIFAGTGCLGIFILKNTKSSVDFLDIDSEAIAEIKINLSLNKIPKEKYRIWRSDMFGKVGKKKYDFIFANPPYVATSRIREVQKEVLESEPLAALFGGFDGLEIIRGFLKEVGRHLSLEGVLFLEFDPLQKKEIKNILAKEGLKTRFFKDQFGKERWLKATKLI